MNFRKKSLAGWTGLEADDLPDLSGRSNQLT
jgi:hypothetical protein